MNPLADKFLLSTLLILLFIAGIVDWRTYKIPNILTLPAAVGALTYYGVGYGGAGIGFSLAGFGTGILLLIVPYLAGGMGGGDVKLLAMIGAFLGTKAVFIAFLYIAIIGGFYAVAVFLAHNNDLGLLFSALHTIRPYQLVQTLISGTHQPSAESPRLRYGLAIGLGTGLYILTRTSGFTLF